jgi:hypothetical protein
MKITSGAENLSDPPELADVRCSTVIVKLAIGFSRPGETVNSVTVSFTPLTMTWQRRFPSEFD